MVVCLRAEGAAGYNAETWTELISMFVQRSSCTFSEQKHLIAWHFLVLTRDVCLHLGEMRGDSLLHLGNSDEEIFNEDSLKQSCLIKEEEVLMSN